MFRYTVVFWLLFATLSAAAQQVHIGVLGLFHPDELILEPLPGKTLSIAVQGTPLAIHFGQRAKIRATQSLMLVTIDGSIIRSATLNLSPSDFTLTVVGHLRRHYLGGLELTASAGTLLPVVSMDLETAVASVVAAEYSPDTPLEALKAQAVVTRSYLLAAKARHPDFDFCDTTHCQFLREPPPSDSAAATAANATRGIVLSYQDYVVAAMFTRSCAGHTRTPAEIRMQSASYPYFSVTCKYCYEHPYRWTRSLSAHDAQLVMTKGELGRLEITRREGWGAIPSNNFIAQSSYENHGSLNDKDRKVSSVLLTGAGQGHGIGLCQRGAQAMAAEGVSFRKILAHYFPNTALRSMP
jgi:stage II sporulation protein D